MNFSELAVGDIAIFTQKFTASDFAAFELLSRDNNSLHHNVQYAHESGYSSPIVPIHLTSLPLSRVAGCIFPGKSSLYLKHSVTALNPVYYDNNLTYSAKITSKSDSTRLITIQNICFNKSTSNVAFVAEMSVRSRHDDDEITLSSDINYIPSSTKKSIVILGASSSIGSSIALELAKMNYNLILVYKKEGRIFSDLLSKLNQMRYKHSSIQADLSSSHDLHRLSKFLEQISNSFELNGIIQCACPSIYSPLDLHIKVGYEALKSCVDSMLPSLISRQDGIIAFISSIATERFQGSSWDSYVMGKTVADKYLHRISSEYTRYGLRCISLMPSAVDTDFISGMDLNRENLLSPIQVADEFASKLKESSQSGTLVIENNSSFWKGFGSCNISTIENSSLIKNSIESGSSNQSSNPSISNSEIVNGKSVDEKLFEIFARVFNVSPDKLTQSTAIDNIPEWDSLNHLSLVCEVERNFSIELSGQEIQDALSFKSLKSIIVSKN
jgi:acyl carrier protein